MAIRVVDNKKVEMTTDEYKEFQEICKAHDQPPSNKGVDLFKDLFETDPEGKIIYLKSPSRPITMQVYLFLVNLMQHQHLRAAVNTVNKMAETMEGKIKELEAKYNELFELAPPEKKLKKKV